MPHGMVETPRGVDFSFLSFLSFFLFFLSNFVVCVQGVRRPPLPDYLDIKKAFAVHECGKALVAMALRQQTGRMEQVERVSIVPRGR